ncbi:hypothetical protein CY34DRAFT_16310 [Suillus luteus UH-Slu-Lm8-n1]|uniref:AMP-dependent synthetase/ligase domain-containing protein n=1 Tax=Suillus luteus UH-Slu-Lm8-n1 TaxID=930992 RepID=A0A0D0AXH2_9AGAM|nr:hypothetical protein CY34DRAFT_16310 [Suillus luteus UH-Slu-Lm8-n1]
MTPSDEFMLDLKNWYLFAHRRSLITLPQLLHDAPILPASAPAHVYDSGSTTEPESELDPPALVLAPPPAYVYDSGSMMEPKSKPDPPVSVLACVYDSDSITEPESEPDPPATTTPAILAPICDLDSIMEPESEPDAPAVLAPVYNSDSITEPESELDVPTTAPSTVATPVHKPIFATPSPPPPTSIYWKYVSKEEDAAWKTLGYNEVKIMALYYNKMAFYMEQALFGIQPLVYPAPTQSSRDNVLPNGKIDKPTLPFPDMMQAHACYFSAAAGGHHHKMPSFSLPNGTPKSGIIIKSPGSSKCLGATFQLELSRLSHYKLTPCFVETKQIHIHHAIAWENQLDNHSSTTSTLARSSVLLLPTFLVFRAAFTFTILAPTTVIAHDDLEGMPALVEHIGQEIKVPIVPLCSALHIPIYKTCRPPSWVAYANSTVMILPLSCLSSPDSHQLKQWSSVSTKPMKGMLSGPVAILNWSFPRDDVPCKLQSQQLALALHDEVIDLEKADISAIQVDEPTIPSSPSWTTIIYEADEPEDGRLIAYAELLREVCSIANILKALGVKKGDTVTVYLLMIWQSVAADQADNVEGPYF